MSQGYSNLPAAAVPDTSSTVQAFDNYQSQPIELSSAVLAAMTAFFTKRGFGEVAAESITVTVMTQAKQDGYNPMQILDTLKGLSNVELSGLVSEILNYNRFKSSSLGYAQTIKPNAEIQRWILDTGYPISAINPFILTDETGASLTTELGTSLTIE